MFRLGIPTLMEIPDVPSMIGLCNELGAEFIELNMNFPLYQWKTLQQEHIFKWLTEAGIGCSVHLPEQLDFGSFQPESREAAVHMIENMLELVPPATRFIAHMNSGIKVSLPSGPVYAYERFESDFLADIQESASICNTLLTQSGCFLCMENIGNFHFPFIQKGLGYLLEHDHIALVWDVGHDATAAGTDSPFFDRHRNKIRQLHLHDSLDGADHLPLFTGMVDIPGHLFFAKERNLPVVIEVKTAEGLRRSFAQLRNRGFLEEM